MKTPILVLLCLLATALFSQDRLIISVSQFDQNLLFDKNRSDYSSNFRQSYSFEENRFREDGYFENQTHRTSTTYYAQGINLLGIISRYRYGGALMFSAGLYSRSISYNESNGGWYWHHKMNEHGQPNGYENEDESWYQSINDESTSLQLGLAYQQPIVQLWKGKLGLSAIAEFRYSTIISRKTSHYMHHSYHMSDWDYQNPDSGKEEYYRFSSNTTYHAGNEHILTPSLGLMLGSNILKFMRFGVQYSLGYDLSIGSYQMHPSMLRPLAGFFFAAPLRKHVQRGPKRKDIKAFRG